MPAVAPPSTEESPLALFLRFLRFGFLAWGGPVAQIAMIRRELVDDEKWLSAEQFNRLLAAYQVLPGPEAHELCVHIGTLRAGRLGGLLAGLGFMLPGFVLVLGLSALYARIALDRPPLSAIFLGMQIAVIAIIVRAVHRIGAHVLVALWLWALAVLTFAGALLGASFWISLPAAGIAYALAAGGRWIPAVLVIGAAALLAWLLGAGTDPAMVAAPATAGEAVGALTLLWTGLKAGLLTFGGAYTAIPFVRGDAVGRGWISDQTFLDGLALSGIVPAPLIIFATFVGFQVAGLAGAVAITVGIFLPAFVFGMVLTRSIERITEDERLHDFLEGVAAGVVGLIAATALDLARGLVPQLPSLPLAALLFAACLAIAYWWKSKLNVLAIVALAALGGWALFG
ncbi:MAG: chromate efflux transporter [Sphingomicrobium sp.]